MAIDTDLKRASALHVGLPFRMTPPPGTTPSIARQFSALCYVGLAASAPPPFLAEWAVGSNQLLGFKTQPVTK